MDGSQPIKVGLIGGTGLAASLLSEASGRRHEIETPFGKPSDAIIETTWEGVDVLLLSRHGPGHTLPPSSVPFRANIFALKQLGCTHILASGAVGSLRQEFSPRDLAIADQIIDKTSKRPATFYEHAAVHVEFAEPFCPVLRKLLIEEGSLLATAAATGDGVKPFAVHGRGCYVVMEGPAFSTRAESLMHRLWGGDLIGMTAMPEAKLAREAEIPYALIALVTDYDCWKSPPKPADGEKLVHDSSALLKEILDNLMAASSNGVALMRKALRRMAAEPALLATCPARDALKLALWSDKTKIDSGEIERLAPLWGRYFEKAVTPV
jgi:5'-methylthioadenosine phosphorylase